MEKRRRPLEDWSEHQVVAALETKKMGEVGTRGSKAILIAFSGSPL